MYVLVDAATRVAVIGRVVLCMPRCVVCSREKVVVLQEHGSQALRELASQAYLQGLPTYSVDDVNKTLVRHN